MLIGLREWRRLALALLPAVLLLAGCATDPETGRPTFGRAEAAAPAGPPAFTIEVVAPDDIRQYLTRHLELQRYRELQDLDDGELRRLLAAADANARDLLGTLGYFSPDVAIELKDAVPEAASAWLPASATPTAAATPTRKVVITITPGTPVRIAGVDIGFAGAIAADPRAATQRQNIQDLWPLRPGLRFTQAEWDDAKAVALRLLTSLRYPTGQISESKAEIDADQKTAALKLKLDSGPAFRFGEMQVSGTNHFTPELVQRLAQLPTGYDYDQQRMLEAQQRVADSGYFDSVFMTLDTSQAPSRTQTEPDATPDPITAPVLTQVREAKLQKIVLGVGASTDAGPRVSLEHTHHLLPFIGWRAVTKLSADRATKSAGIDLTGQPDESYWRWLTSALVQRADTNGVTTDSQRYRVGKSRTGERLDRSYYLQYDDAHDVGTGLNSGATAISANYAWTQRNFDSILFPSRGYGLGVEVGGGTTLGTAKDPFFRTHANWLAFVPLNLMREADGSRVRGSRLALRAEGGAVVARDGAVLPSTQLFFAGGDNSVRGYGLKDIGITSPTGVVSAGRYVAVGSVEWQRPIIYNGKLTDWESTLFVDAGAVADKPQDMKAKVGIGAGARWRSPVGPLQMDLAYGVATHKVRLHLTVGFTF